MREARASFAQRLHVRTTAPMEALTALGGIDKIRIEDKSDEETTYEIELEDGADPQGFLERAVAAGIAITRFEQAGATLHDIFVALAGDEAEETTATGRSAYGGGGMKQILLIAWREYRQYVFSRGFLIFLFMFPLGFIGVSAGLGLAEQTKRFGTLSFMMRPVFTKTKLSPALSAVTSMTP